MLAPIQDSRLLLPDGLVGSVNGTYLDGQETWPSIRGDTITNMTQARAVYRPAPDHTHLQGRSGEHRLGRRDPDPPGQLCRIHRRGAKTWIIAALGLLLALLALSFFLARRFVRPITDSLKRFQQEELPEQGLSSGISEVDELAEFLNARARNQRLEQGELPPNIAELFDQFVARKDLLTEAERNILRYYIDGHEIADIPDLAFISMSTVRKHNRSIYEKLGVASRDELMLYIDLLRRCGRLQELF